MNKLLSTYLDRRLSEPTVILCFRILLDNGIKNGFDSKMSKSEIEKVFNIEHNYFGVQTFRRDYVMRQSGNKNNAIDQTNEQFFIRTEYIEGMNSFELQSVSDYINNHYKGKINEREIFLKRIINTKDEEKYNLIKGLLIEEETDRRGQNFEVVSFAILRTFYECRGFELNRFSTIYANDGGVDFAAQNAIYQVTTQLNDKKLIEDLNKAPLKKRIFVYRELSPKFDKSLLENDLIIDSIGTKELLDHLEYLRNKKSNKNLNRIIEVILEEYNREYYLS